ISIALRLRRVAAALYGQDHRKACEGWGEAYCRRDPRLLGRLPGDAGRDRAGKRRNLQAQRWRAICRHSLPQRQRSRHGRDSTARFARVERLDIAAGINRKKLLDKPAAVRIREHLVAGKTFPSYITMS